ncbi:MAG TPA: peptidoglycan recognition family protein [Phycisphaerales bacterium]|nr:peptidoglycan recognition family protein [Phycisphaerales bacterium]
MMMRPTEPEKTGQPMHELTRRQMLQRGLGGLFLLAGAGGLLSGCSSMGDSDRAEALSDMHWPRDPLSDATGPSTGAAKPMPSPGFDVPAGIIPRSAWARGAPVTARMTRADRPFTKITVHHDGMKGSFNDPSYAAAARRLESIRQGHLSRNPEPFGDIGYHYLIDPAGRVWQGRELVWQGAHVKDRNPGNLGICMLGNYDNQSPNQAQLAALDRFVAEQARKYRVSLMNVKTHREWDGAHTACPGTSLQAYMKVTRAPGGTIARTAFA